MPSPVLRLRPLDRRALLLLALLGVATCGEDPLGPDVLAITVSPRAGLAVGLGSTVLFSAYALHADGDRRFTEAVTWAVEDARIATIDDGGLARAVAEGVTRVTASADGRSETVTLEVYVPDDVPAYVPGTSYFGRNDYVEYIPGELPVVLSAPHGGDRTPDEIATRTWGVTGTDRSTVELTLAVRQAFIDQTGSAPHVILSHLHRAKLDANREIVEAAQGDAFAERAWEEFHDYIEVARRSVVGGFGGGMYFDLHGHGHEKQRLELGYLLDSDRLNGTDASLNALSVIRTTSVREIGRTRPDTFAEVIRGATSLGAYLEAEGVPVLPGPMDPRPGDDPYFTGGYATRRHGSLQDSELVSGVQIEHHFAGIRDSDEARRAYAERLARAIEAFVTEHFGFFEPPPAG